MRTPYMNYDMCYVFRCEQNTFPFFKILKKKNGAISGYYIRLNSVMRIEKVWKQSTLRQRAGITWADKLLFV